MPGRAAFPLGLEKIDSLRGEEKSKIATRASFMSSAVPFPPELNSLSESPQAPSRLIGGEILPNPARRTLNLYRPSQPAIPDALLGSGQEFPPESAKYTEDPPRVTGLSRGTAAASVFHEATLRDPCAPV